MCKVGSYNSVIIPPVVKSGTVTNNNPVSEQPPVEKPQVSTPPSVPKDPVMGKGNGEVKQDVNAAFSNGGIARNIDTLPGLTDGQAPKAQINIASATRLTPPQNKPPDEARAKAIDQAAETIYKAMKGMGTDEDAIIKALKDLPPEDRSKVRDKFNEKYLDKTGYSFDAWIDSELGQNGDKATLETVYALVDRSNPNPVSDLRKNFEGEFRKDCIQHAKDAGSIATGTMNNIAVTVTFGAKGDGCSAWQDWMDGAVDKWRAEGCNVEPVHVDVGPGGSLNHNLFRITFPDGTSSILDPWANPEKPFHDEAEYKAEHGGQIFTGQYHKGESMSGRKEIEYAPSQPYYPNH
jgi:hypothetical protein